MPTFGYFLSAEEHTPQELVTQAVLAEHAGFEALWISDHFHPWNDEQGESPFVWAVIGAIAQATSLPVTTAVTCPTVRIHPAIIAQAAATSALLSGGRFRLGVGSGENLNEHVLGDRWPPADIRLEMLEEAIEVMRELWTGEQVTHRGTPLHGRERPPVLAARRAGPGVRLRLRAQGHVARGARRRRLLRDHARRRAAPSVPRRGREGSAPGRREAVLGTRS
jgi:alkanesulfonate monooxygenase SsuD/methylene tetrahydromethanopterin reductase-like flavin-dependent oxidoreductase (luciferase family)